MTRSRLRHPPYGVFRKNSCSGCYACLIYIVLNEQSCLTGVISGVFIVIYVINVYTFISYYRVCGILPIVIEKSV